MIKVSKLLVGKQIDLAHPLYNVPTKATIKNVVFGGQGLELSFPCGHVTHLYINEINDLVGKLPTIGE